MDRNSLIGIGLMLLLTITYFYIFPPKTPEEQAQTSTTQTSTTQTDTLSKADSQTVVEAPQYTPEKLEQALDTDSLKTAMYGPFSKAMSVENTLPPVHIATDVLDLQIHPQGAQIRPIVLKKFKTSKGEPLVLVADHPANYTAFQLRYKGQFIDSRQLFYEPSLKEIRIAGARSKELRLRATFGQDTFIEHRFVFVGDKYDFRHSIHLKGLEKVVNENVLYLTQQLYTPQTEKSLEKMIPEVQLCYKFTSESGVERLELSEDEVVEERIKMDIEWFAMKSQFFSSALFASERFQNSSLKIVPNELLSRFPAEDQDGKTLSVPQDAVKLLRGDAALALTPSNKTDSVSFRHYYGPNDISLMGNYDNNFDRVVQLGWGPLRYIALFFHFIFNWLQGFISNYGIIILILAAFIKIALHPLTYRSYLSTAKMQVVNEMPEVKELEKKYADNATELQQKKMAFYNQIGINPMGGCLPLLLQFPILISMFNFFPQSIELRQQAFLWADDLSTYDSVYDFGFTIPFYGDHISMFTLLMTISTLAYTYIQQKTQGSNVPAQMRIISYLMPVVFLGILNNYSSGLSYYYLVFNVLTIGHMQLIKQFIDKDKLHEQIIEAKHKKSKKPKGWMQRWMEDKQKQQREMQRDRSRQRK